MIERVKKRRKLGNILHEPILEMYNDRRHDSVIFIEKDEADAQKTRAAALMFIGREELELTTAVKGNEIWVMKNRDDLGDFSTVDLREFVS